MSDWCMSGWWLDNDWQKIILLLFSWNPIEPKTGAPIIFPFTVAQVTLRPLLSASWHWPTGQTVGSWKHRAWAPAWGIASRVVVSVTRWPRRFPRPKRTSGPYKHYIIQGFGETMFFLDIDNAIIIHLMPDNATKTRWWVLLIIQPPHMLQQARSWILQPLAMACTTDTLAEFGLSWWWLVAESCDLIWKEPDCGKTGNNTLGLTWEAGQKAVHRFRDAEIANVIVNWCFVHQLLIHALLDDLSAGFWLLNLRTNS